MQQQPSKNSKERKLPLKVSFLGKEEEELLQRSSCRWHSAETTSSLNLSVYAPAHKIMSFFSTGDRRRTGLLNVAIKSLKWRKNFKSLLNLDFKLKILGVKF